MTEEENFLEYVFPILRYHSRWNELTEDDLKYFWKRDKVTHNGYYMRVDALPARDVPEGKVLADYNFGEKLCEENGVELVLVKAPSLYPYWYDEWDGQMEDYAKEHNLKYYNFLKAADEIGLDFDTDTYDAGLHLNLSGAQKLSSYFGKILAEECGVKSRRGEAELERSWERKCRDYEEEIKRQQEALETGKFRETEG